MKKVLALSIVTAIILTMSGCGESPKSVEELSKLSKAELESMFKECDNALETKYKKDNTLKEIRKITDDIMDTREAKDRKFPFTANRLYVALGSVTDDELAKFGNSKYAEFVACGRIYAASLK